MGPDLALARPASVSGDGRFASLWPVYPALLAIAWIVSLHSESTATVHALLRPLVVCVVLVLITQATASLVLRNRHIGAIVVALAGLIGVGFVAAALVACAVLAIGLGVAARQGRTLRSLPWQALTRALNMASVILLGIVLASSVIAGALTPPEKLQPSARDAIHEGAPDIYLVLLDGYPRSDTLSRDFGYDNEPFLAELHALGFDVSRQSHSNYNGTELTLASMLNMAHVADLPDVAKGPSSPQAQTRALTRSINQGRALDELRGVGYEIVTAPSAISSMTLYGADRVIDEGQISSFELEILQQGILRQILPDFQRTWLTEQHRARISSTFARLGDLAAERVDHPRFVFAHLLAPHAPIAFGPAGEARYGWPCFPVSCSMFYGGQRYGSDVLDPIRGEIEYLNNRLVDTARQIIDQSEHPPVIVFFSDHGSRHDFDDRDEMLRSIFVATTPEHPDLFPQDVTPINIIPRLLNAYAGTDLSLATEESYLVDMRTVDSTGILELFPWNLPVE